MRKSTKRNGAWTVVLDLGWKTDPTTGKRKRNQFRFTHRGKKIEAERKLNEQLNKIFKHEFVEPDTITFGQWLEIWVENSIKPPIKRLRTYESYKSIITIHLQPELGNIRLQELQAVQLEAYYRKKGEKLSQTTLEHHHAIISRSLKSAQRKNYVIRNVAPLVENRPKKSEDQMGAREHCWDQQEVQQFLQATKGFSPQAEAFYALALDTGMRKGELCGLQWANVDLDDNTVTVVEQLVKPGPEPIFGPPKNGVSRGITISSQTASLLRTHRKGQNELKLKNGKTYRDHGLVFAKEWNQMTRSKDTLGDPLQMNNLGQREFAKIIETAGIRAIKFHGMRHTCATLLLKARVPVHVVSQRLGHKGVDITMNIYAHLLPSMQKEAAETMGAILFK
jgi:integrase